MICLINLLLFCRSRWRRHRCCLRSLSLKLWIYDFHIFKTSSSSFHGFITNQFNDLLPVGLLASLVEPCTGITEVKGSNPVQAWLFFRLSFCNCKNCVYNCDDLPSYNAPYHCSMEKKRTNSPCLQHWRSHHALVTTGQQIPVHTNRQDEEESEKTTEIGRGKTIRKGWKKSACPAIMMVMHKIQLEAFIELYTWKNFSIVIG